MATDHGTCVLKKDFQGLLDAGSATRRPETLLLSPLTPGPRPCHRESKGSPVITFSVPYCVTWGAAIQSWQDPGFDSVTCGKGVIQWEKPDGIP